MGLDESNWRIYKEVDEKDKNKLKVLISVEIPQAMINAKAEEMGLMCSLKNKLSLGYIKQKYDQSFKNKYLKFDHSARDDAIDEILREELDFKFYKETGVLS